MLCIWKYSGQFGWVPDRQAKVNSPTPSLAVGKKHVIGSLAVGKYNVEPKAAMKIDVDRQCQAWFLIKNFKTHSKTLKMYVEILYEDVCFFLKFFTKVLVKQIFRPKKTTKNFNKHLFNHLYRQTFEGSTLCQVGVSWNYVCLSTVLKCNRYEKNKNDRLPSLQCSYTPNKEVYWLVLAYSHLLVVDNKEESHLDSVYWTPSWSSAHLSNTKMIS